VLVEFPGRKLVAAENGSVNASHHGREPGTAAPVSRVWISRAHAWCEARYGLDLRSIALFRVGIGALLVSDLCTRAIDLRAHYTDLGILPRERLVSGWGQQQFYSLHMFGGDTASQVVLFLVAGVFATMLVVGYRTRLAAFVSWVLLCSLQGRNYAVLQGGDDLLRVMLFWSMFVPLGARFSVDTLLAERRTLPPRLLSLGTTVLVLQLFTMYLVSAALKTGPSWHGEGSAIRLALHHHAFASSLARWLRELPESTLEGLTWQVWTLELCGPLLFFIPWNTFWWRTLGAHTFVAFHFGLFLTLELGHYPWVAMVCWLVVLPSWFWDEPVRRLLVRAGLLDRLRQLSQKTQAAIAQRRNWFGPPRRFVFRPSWLGLLSLLVIASYAGYGSAYAMTHGGNVDGKRFDPLLITRLYANWGMFAPNPPSTSGWFVSVAKQKSGAEIDVWNDGQPVSFDPPPLPSASYKRQRWRKLGDNLLSDDQPGLRSSFVRWLCRAWNEEHTGLEQIKSVTLYHVAQTANSTAKGYGPLSQTQLAREKCLVTP